VTDDGLHDQLLGTRTELNAYVSDLHRPVAPWGLSPFEVLSRIHELPSEAETPTRFRGSVLAGLDSDRDP
jgi:hypothetical protein